MLPVIGVIESILAILDLKLNSIKNIINNNYRRKEMINSIDSLFIKYSNLKNKSTPVPTTHELSFSWSII